MSMILALETATPMCSVALGHAGKLLALREVDSPELAHAEKLNVFMAEVLAEANVEMEALDAVAVGTGPGSYTGLRIGLSAAKGLCFALGKPILGISTPDTLWQAAWQTHGPFDGTWWPMIDARRMEVFTCPYGAAGQAIGTTTPLVLDTDWAAVQEPRIVFGDGADKAADLWKAHPWIVHLPGIRPSAAAMLGIAAERLGTGAVDDLAYLVPDYGKEANTGKPR